MSEEDKESIKYEIRGKILEKESKLEINNLLIKAFDFEKRLKEVVGITDSDGEFTIYLNHSEEYKKGIILEIYKAPMILIEIKQLPYKTKEKVEELTIVITRNKIEQLSPSLSRKTFENTITFDEKHIKLEKKQNFTQPKIKGHRNRGVPGTPSIPTILKQIILPENASITEFEIQTKKPKILIEKINPFPVQEPKEIIPIDTFKEIERKNRIKFTHLDIKKMEGKKRYPEELVKTLKKRRIGPLQIITIQISPIQYDIGNQSYIFYSEITYKTDVLLKKEKDNFEYSSDLLEILNSIISSKKFSLHPSIFDMWRWSWGLWERIKRKLTYVIITDDYKWPEHIVNNDGTIRSPAIEERGPNVGNLTSHFRRLVNLKKLFGIKAKIVTISEIINQTYGDFTEGGFARDLQEVIRNFLKFVNTEWRALYVLLGGDISIIPIRKLVLKSVSMASGCWFEASNPPLSSKFCYVGNYTVMKLNPYFTPKVTEPLSCSNGKIIPYNENADNNNPGWFYTTEADFNNNDNNFTNFTVENNPSKFIIVKGITNEYILNNREELSIYVYWIKRRNHVPSDFYYSSIKGPEYSLPNLHDFDKNDNGYYGQYDSYYDSATDSIQEDNIDSMSWNIDLYIGRASVESSSEASAIVNKIIEYSLLLMPTFQTRDIYDEGQIRIKSSEQYLSFVLKNLRSAYRHLKKINYVQANLTRSLWLGKNNDNIAPEFPSFFSVTDENNVLIPWNYVCAYYILRLNLEDDITLDNGVISDRLLWYRYDWDRLEFVFDSEIPYNENADQANPGWFFTTDNTYENISLEPTLFIEIIGEWGKEYGIIVLDPIAWDPYVAHMEELRESMNIWFPDFDNVTRYYEDYLGIPEPPPLDPLSEPTIRNALNTGAHFVSLSGHGSWRGCCEIDVSTNPTFNNNGKYFIMFANSCNTAMIDALDDDGNPVDSLAEISTISPNGAVAYVGNTRLGLGGIGDDYEMSFWKNTSILRRPGVAANLRETLTGDSHRWYLYNQHFFGDPEMKVWISMNYYILNVKHPARTGCNSQLNIHIAGVMPPLNVKDYTILIRSPFPKVTLIGFHLAKSLFFTTKEPNPRGNITFDIQQEKPCQLFLVITHPQIIPYIATIDVT